MPSPIAKSLEGQTIWSKRGNARGVCDRYGAKLVSLQLDNEWSVAHDYFKHALCEVMRDLRVDYNCEVFGLFSPLIPQGPLRVPLDADTRQAAHKRQGMVPDFKINSSSLSRRLRGGAQAIPSTLAELKFIHLGTTRYPVASILRGHLKAVELRARLIGREMEAHARSLDVVYGGHPAGSDGPVLLRLRSYGQVVPLVVGHFGEWSSELGGLVSALAEDAAPRMAAEFGASSQRAARHSILFFARRSLVWAGLVANARLKLARSVFIGPTWASAALGAQEAARRDDQAGRRRREGAAHWRASGAQGVGAARRAFEEA